MKDFDNYLVQTSCIFAPPYFWSLREVSIKRDNVHNVHQYWIFLQVVINFQVSVQTLTEFIISDCAVFEKEKKGISPISA